MFRLSKNQTIGAFVILTLIALFFVINFLRGGNLFKNNDVYYSTYYDVEGLTLSSPVYIRGLKIGSINAIQYLPGKNIFEVKYTIQSEYKIPIDSQTELYSSDLLGAKALRIAIGTSSEFHKSGDTLKSAFKPDLLTMLSTEIIPIKDQISELLDNLNTLSAGLNSIFDDKSQQSLRESITNLNLTLSNAGKITSDLSDITPGLDEIVKNVDSLIVQLSLLVESVDGGVSDFRGVAQQISESDLQEAINSLNSLINNIQSPDGSLGKIIHTDSLHNAVNNFIIELNSLIKKIEENPKKYLKISVF